MNRTLPQLIRLFEIELIDPNKPISAEALFFVVHSSLNVRIQERPTPL